MHINKINCGKCFGRGHITLWEIKKPDSISGTGTAVTCSQCEGRGYTEYPVFTVEEAIDIAKHFGFDIIGGDTND